MNRLKNSIMTGCRLSVILLLVAAVSSCCEGSNKVNAQEKAKYIFLFIGDGMGAGNVAVTESYLSYKNGKIGGEHLTFTEFPVFGMATTYSANRQITCSSAAGTAISCGEKTNNRSLCVDPDGNRMESITYKLKRDGYKIGIMSNVPINHATPAAFYGHNKNRNAYYSISQEIPQSGFDFFAGDGFLDYYGDDNKEEPITDYLERNGADVCFSLSEYEKCKAGADQMILCLPSSRGQDSEEYETGKDTSSDMSLGDMLATCLDFIGEEAPFFVMCEGGKIDWYAHDNNTVTMINDIIGLNDAVDVAYEFYLKHPDETLILVTADHETGGAALGGPEGKSKRGNNVNWEVFDGYSFEDAIALDKKKLQELNLEANIGWTTTGHAGGPVPVYAIGKGAERFSGMMDNTDICPRILCED